MADSSNKTEEPTGHKLNEARKKGQFARSSELVTAAVLGAGVAATGWMLRSLVAGTVILASWSMRQIATVDQTSGDFTARVGEVGVAMSPILQQTALFFLIVTVTAIAVSLIQSGVFFSTFPLTPQLDRLNPINGVKRILSPQGLVNNLKMVLRAAVMIWVGIAAVRSEAAQMGLFSSVSPLEAVNFYTAMALRVAWKLVAAAGVMAAVDVAYQKFQFKKSMKMSRQEVMDENKMLEGDPQIKSRQKRFRRQMYRRMRLDRVKEARVVVTNPTHYAVALKYEGGDNEIPVVVARGKNYRARLIKEIARAHRIRIMEAPPLARALYASVEVGKHIPPALFLATAEILVLVNKLDAQFKGAPAGSGRAAEAMRAAALKEGEA